MSESITAVAISRSLVSEMDASEVETIDRVFERQRFVGAMTCRASIEDPEGGCLIELFDDDIVYRGIRCPGKSKNTRTNADADPCLTATDASSIEFRTGIVISKILEPMGPHLADITDTPPAEA